jgi:tight adherence protein C
VASLLELIIYIGTFGLAATGTLLAVGAFQRRVRLYTRLEPENAASGVDRSDKLIVSRVVKNPILAWIRAATIEKSGEEKGLRRKLALAGFDNPAAPVWYVVARMSAATIPALAFVSMQASSAQPMTGPFAVLAPAILTLVGFIAPQAVIDNLANSRREKLLQQFPDALDLLVICIEAGVGLESAIVRISQDTLTSHPEIARELIRLSQEVSAGRSRDEALHAMGVRTDVEIIRAFAAVVAQSDSLGVSIGQTLRTFAVEMRETRFLSAEEKAMRIPVLMTIPLVACILPVVMTSLLLPAIIDVIRTIGPALSNR